MRDYLLLLIGEETAADDPRSDAFWEEVARYQRFEELAGDAIVEGHALEPSVRGVSIRRSADATPLVTDGPFTEATEVAGGLFVLRCEDLDRAIELARELPVAHKDTGAVEVRPIAGHWQPGRQRTPGSRRYVALLRGPDGPSTEPDTDESREATARHEAFERRHETALLSGAELHPSSTASTVRVRDGELLVTDGPFAEAAEVVGGYYLLCAESLDAAVAVMQDVPLGPGWGVELRGRVEGREG